MKEPMTVDELAKHLDELLELYGDYVITISVAGMDKLFIPTDLRIRLKQNVVELHAGGKVRNLEVLNKKEGDDET